MNHNNKCSVKQVITMITLDDVAELSGVSAMTVSRVINNKGAVSEDTRRRVMSAVDKLGYRPNLVARGLATSRTNSVGVLVSRLENPVYAVMVSGINKFASECGMNIILGSGQDESSLLNSVNTLLDKQIDGLIVMPIEIRTKGNEYLKFDVDAMSSFYSEFEGIAKEVTNNGLPIILIGDYQLSGVSGWVREDYKNGAKMAVHYLYEKGHRKIGMVSHKITDRGIWGERYLGFLEGLKEVGCEMKEAYNESSFDWVDDAYEAGMRLFAKKEYPTALYCANDAIAVGILNAAMSSGLRVPQDISIIGHDGSLYSEISCPRLTTVSIRPFEIGRACMEQISMRLSGRKASEVTVIQPSIIEGMSVGTL